MATPGPEPVRLESISAQDMADGARLERCWRGLSDPMVRMYRSGVAVDSRSEWVFSDSYEDPGYLFVPRDSGLPAAESGGSDGQRPSKPVNALVSELRGIAKKAHEAERHRSNKARWASLECACRFWTSTSKLETEVWTVWRDRWQLMRETQDATCFYELVGDAWKLGQTIAKLRLVSVTILTRKLQRTGELILAWRRSRARIAECVRRAQENGYFSRAMKSVMSIPSAWDMTRR
jgi:hypothetical protein